MRRFLMRLSLATRQVSLPLMKVLCVMALILTGIMGWMYGTYERIAKEAEAEELAFWEIADAMTLEERSALLSHSLRTGTLPHVLPWWEHDRHMCSAVVVKYLALFTGIKLVHSSAWEVRKKKACPNCVSNARKLTTVWDGTESFGHKGDLLPETRDELIRQVGRVTADPDKVYLIGVLWDQTGYWDQIQADQADINSHLVMLVRGYVIHFFDTKDESPLRLESPEEMFANKKFAPVWVAEVHEKTRAQRPDWVLRKDDFRLPRVDYEVTFEQNVKPWSSLRRWLIFPSRPWFAKGWLQEVFQRADTLVEKSLLFRMRNGYDMYPTAFHPLSEEEMEP
jgi:hypothetical protein